jgi:DNA-directed RNA polymerase subunit RPC12/RpoP
MISISYPCPACGCIITSETPDHDSKFAQKLYIERKMHIKQENRCPECGRKSLSFVPVVLDSYGEKKNE